LIQAKDRLPNFFILGAAKAGTTTLYDTLSKLPGIYFPFAKESLFFSKDSVYNKGIEWYVQTYYDKAGPFILRGDATPHYLYWSEKVAGRIRNTYSIDPKFIVILRDPVKRAYSWYWNMVREGIENLSFEDAIKTEDARIHENFLELYQQGSMIYGYIRGGCYASQLEPFLSLFPKECFHYILQEDLQQNISGTMHKLLDFLGYDHNHSDFANTRKNYAALPRSKTLQRWLRRQSPVREWLKRIIPIQSRYKIKENLIRLNLRAVSYPNMKHETEIFLRQNFDDEIDRLEHMINRDLSSWRNG
jgi:hypothetical protein